jgi:predicted Zn finger-like uncharacterized protein
MSLATKCPHCRTTFKVANDQLKLQAGLVRCGICQQVFNGIDHAVEINPHVPSVHIEPPASLLVSEDSKIELQHEEAPHKEEQQNLTHQNLNLPTLPFSDIDDVEEIIISKSGIDDAEFDREMLAEAANNLAKSDQIVKPARNTTHSNQTALRASDEAVSPETISPNVASEPEVTDAKELEQLSFVRQANIKQRFNRLFFICVPILFILLVGQTIFLFRNYIAAIYPPAQKTLVTLCEYAHCQIDLLAQLDALSYEAAELHSLPRANTFEFGLLLRNHSALTQAWPHIELTLQNAQKQTVLRRVFAPADYLANPDDVASGFSSHQEYVVHLNFEVDQVKASDFTAEIFYP